MRTRPMMCYRSRSRWCDAAWESSSSPCPSPTPTPTPGRSRGANLRVIVLACCQQSRIMMMGSGRGQGSAILLTVGTRAVRLYCWIPWGRSGLAVRRGRTAAIGVLCWPRVEVVEVARNLLPASTVAVPSPAPFRLSASTLRPSANNRATATATLATVAPL